VKKKSLFILLSVVAAIILFTTAAICNQCAVPSEEELFKEANQRAFEKAVESVETVRKATEELTEAAEKASEEAAADAKGITGEDVENIKQKVENITLEGPIEGLVNGRISFTIDFKAGEFEGNINWNNESCKTAVVFGTINLKTNAIDGKAAGKCDTEEVGPVPYVMVMEGLLSYDLEKADGTLIDEDGEVFKWHAKKTPE